MALSQASIRIPETSWRLSAVATSPSGYKASSVCAPPLSSNLRAFNAKGGFVLQGGRSHRFQLLDRCQDVWFAGYSNWRNHALQCAGSSELHSCRATSKFSAERNTEVRHKRAIGKEQQPQAVVKSDGIGEECSIGRRPVLELAVLAGLVAIGGVGAGPAQAYKPPPEGFRRYTDRLDGFTLLVPDYWVQVRGSGAEVQFRSPQNGDENLFVAVSSPSSSKYTGVKDLGSPEDSSKFIRKQYVAEYMSTRLGVRRTAEVVSASSKEVEEGKPYYQIEMSVKSEANSNQLAVTPEERIPFVEWERRYITVQAVENRRLYELRVQIPADIYARERPLLQTVLDSFRTFPVEGFEGSKPV